MSDLIERLNGLRPIGHVTGNSDYELINPDGPEAAQAITALTAERDILREAYDDLRRYIYDTAAGRRERSITRFHAALKGQEQ